jgi:hypothetical protein
LQGRFLARLHVGLLQLPVLEPEQILPLAALCEQRSHLLPLALAGLPSLVGLPVVLPRLLQMAGRIQRIHLGLGRQERLLFMLAMDIDQGAGEALQGLERGQAAVEVQLVPA